MPTRHGATAGAAHLGHAGGSHGDKAVALALPCVSVLDDAHMHHGPMSREELPDILLGGARVQVRHIQLQPNLLPQAPDSGVDPGCWVSASRPIPARTGDAEGSTCSMSIPSVMQHEQLFEMSSCAHLALVVFHGAEAPRPVKVLLVRAFAAQAHHQWPPIHHLPAHS